LPWSPSPREHADNADAIAFLGKSPPRLRHDDLARLRFGARQTVVGLDPAFAIRGSLWGNPAVILLRGAPHFLVSPYGVAAKYAQNRRLCQSHLRDDTLATNPARQRSARQSHLHRAEPSLPSCRGRPDKKQQGVVLQASHAVSPRLRRPTGTVATTSTRNSYLYPRPHKPYDCKLPCRPSRRRGSCRRACAGRGDAVTPRRKVAEERLVFACAARRVRVELG